MIEPALVTERHRRQILLLVTAIGLELAIEMRRRQNLHRQATVTELGLVLVIHFHRRSLRPVTEIEPGLELAILLHRNLQIRRLQIGPCKERFRLCTRT